jgi:phage major head subunit gpT-like protein
MPNNPHMEGGNRLILAAENTEFKSTKIDGIAYSGGAIGQTWSGNPIVVDLATLKMADQIPLMFNHQYSPEYRLGVVSCQNDGKKITFSGEIDTEKPLGSGIIAEGKKYHWQASIGSDPVSEVDQIKAGETAVLNGREFTGPMAIVRGAKLREVSVVALGADSETHIRIAAGFTNQQGGKTMENQKIETPATEPEKVQASLPDDAVAKAVQAAIAKRDAEQKGRIDAIDNVFGKDLPELKLEAITKNWTVEESKTALIKALRENKPAVPNVYVQGNHAGRGEMIHAAALISAGVNVDDVVKDIGAPAVEAAQKQYRSGMGPKRLVLECAHANGFTDSMIDSGNWYEAASHGVRAGFSNVSLSGILANVYNKRLLQGFRYADQSWREIASIASVSDFKAINSYRLNMTGGFEVVGSGGELKHAALSDESFSNQAKTYGKMLGLTRQDIINDDLGALNDVPFMFGRAAANSFNRVFWTAFLDNSTFFASGNKNVQTSAIALSLAGLEQAESGFYAITAADGEVTGIKPAILLVPIGLKNLANQLYNDSVLGVTALGATNAKAVSPVSNPLAGQFKPVATPYLSDVTISGYSATDYYLLADPMDCAVIQAVFLNGRQEPFVESSAAEFNTLGILYRAYMDWGVAKQDPKGGFKQDV